MRKFIVTSEEKDFFDYLGTKIGVTKKRALCYSKEVGKQRTYRHDFDLKGDFKHQIFKTKEEAQEAADYVNEAYNDNFKIEEL